MNTFCVSGISYVDYMVKKKVRPTNQLSGLTEQFDAIYLQEKTQRYL